MLRLSLPETDRRWSLANVVFVTYTVFLAGYFLVPNAVDLYKFYVAAVFLPGLFLLPAALQFTRANAIWLSLLAYLAYMLLSSLWSDNFSIAILWRDIRYVAFIVSFILLTLYFFGRDRRLPDTILQIVALIAIVAATVSVATFPGLLTLPEWTDDRLIGLGTMSNPNPSAFIYGFFGVVAVDFARRHRGGALAKVFAIGAAVIVVFIMLTQSNTGLLAMATACSLLYLTDHRGTGAARPALFTGLVMAAATSVYLAWALGLMNKTIDLGFVNRLPIWQYVLESWRSAPLLGHGYQVTMLVGLDGGESEFNYAHSLFLATLRDGGLLGLALLLLLYFFALRAALRMALTQRRALYLCLFVFGLVCVLVDTDRIVTRPREQWIILWLPLACLIAYELGLTGESSTDSPTAQRGHAPKNTR